MFKSASTVNVHCYTETFSQGFPDRTYLGVQQITLLPPAGRSESTEANGDNVIFKCIPPEGAIHKKII